MTGARQRMGIAAALLILAASAGLSNTLLFRQSVQGETDLARGISGQLGPWHMVDEEPATPSEIRGLETRDIIKRTYSDGRDRMELVVAYIAQSSRKSAHAQEACLRGAGAMVGAISNVEWEGGRLRGKLISIDMGKRRDWVCYWYKIGNTYSAGYLSSSLRMFLGGLRLGQRAKGGSLIRILTPERTGEPSGQIQARMQTFVHHLLPELEKHLP